MSTESLSVGRIGGVGSPWWYMAEVRKWWKNKVLRWRLKQLTEGKLQS